MVVLTGCSEEPSETATVAAPPVEVKTTPWWDGVVSSEVAEEIQAAFDEIGEDPTAIESIEYDSVRETALFDRRDYKVTLKKKSYAHAREWRITTEEWHEGEPERVQYPREYLVAMKFWRDDGNTNINQWTHTGNGRLQTYA